MSEVNYLIITLLIGVCGCLIARSVALPAYALLGSLMATGIYNVFTGHASLPVEIRPLIQIIAGIFIGARVTRGELAGMKGTYKPILLNLTVTIAYSLGFGLVLHRMTSASYVTSAFATAPGGIMDMTLIGMDMGADMGFVTTMQMVRVLTVISIFPLVINLFLTRAVSGAIPQTSIAKPVKPSGSLKDTLITLLVGCLAGGFGYWTDLPAMPLLLAMLGVSVQNVLFDNAYLPKKVKVVIQIGAGILIGQTLTLASVLGLKELFLPTLLMVVVYTLMTLLLGSLLYKTTDLDFPTALFACVPGGATDIAIICEDFGANSVLVSMIQYPRVFVVIAFYPLLIQLLF